MKIWRSAGPWLRPGAHTPGTAASARRRASRPSCSMAATMAPSWSSTSPTKNASKNGASGQGLATAGPPPRTMGSSPSRSAACSGTPARSSISRTFV